MQYTNNAEKGTDVDHESVGQLLLPCCPVAVHHSIYIYSLFLSTFLSLVLSQSFISNERAVSLLLLNTFLYPIGHHLCNTEVISHIITQEVRCHYSFALLTQIINWALEIFKILHSWRTYSIALLNVWLNWTRQRCQKTEEETATLKRAEQNESFQ